MTLVVKGPKPGFLQGGGGQWLEQDLGASQSLFNPTSVLYELSGPGKVT